MMVMDAVEAEERLLGMEERRVRRCVVSLLVLVQLLLRHDGRMLTGGEWRRHRRRLRLLVEPVLRRQRSQPCPQRHQLGTSEKKTIAPSLYRFFS